jgi:hypothetical protein
MSASTKGMSFLPSVDIARAGGPRPPTERAVAGPPKRRLLLLLLLLLLLVLVLAANLAAAPRAMAADDANAAGAAESSVAEVRIPAEAGGCAAVASRSRRPPAAPHRLTPLWANFAPASISAFGRRVRKRR